MVLDDDATGAIRGGSAVEEIGARGGLLCGGYRGVLRRAMACQ